MDILSNIRSLFRRSSMSKEEAVQLINEQLQEIENVLRWNGSPEADRKTISSTILELKELATQAKDAQNPADLVTHAQDLARFRALVMSAAQVKIECQTVSEDLSEWQIPATSLKSIQDRVKADVVDAELADPAKLAQARLTLYSLLDDYNYWDDYIDWYLSSTRSAAVLLFSIATITLVAALIALHQGVMLIGFLLAGLCGTSVSLLAGLPPVSVYGQMMGLWSRIVYRFGVGMAGVVVGCGFLSLGLVELLPKTFHFAEAMDLRPDTVPPSGEAKGGAPASGDTTPPAAEKKLDQPAESSAKEKPAAKRPAHETKPRPTDPQCDGRQQRPSTSTLAAILALAILLGFTERALGSFEDRLFPPEATKKSAT